MGTDWLQLFNKKQADDILAMSRQGLTRYLENNIYILRKKFERPVSSSSLVYVIDKYKLSVTEAIERLLKEGSFAEFRKDVVRDFALGEEWVYLDYWGCNEEAFSGEIPKGAIPRGKYFAEEEEGDFMLLRPEHLDRIIKSLKAHLDDLPVMGKEGVERVKYFRSFCASHPDYWVAYMFDF